MTAYKGGARVIGVENLEKKKRDKRKWSRDIRHRGPEYSKAVRIQVKT